MKILSRTLACFAILMTCNFGFGAQNTGKDAKSVKADKHLTADEIVERANAVSYYQGKDGRAEVSMTIVDKQGRKRHRKFIIIRRDDRPSAEDIKKNPILKKNPELYCKEQQFYVYFLRPADVAKMVFMVHKHIDRDDDRWLYLPALDLVKRIAATDKRTSFVGSHFFYEDVSGRNINADKHELLEVTKKFYKLKHVPKEPDTVEFSYYITWIHRKTFLPIQVEYYDKAGKKYRIYNALKVDKIQGYPTVTRAMMTDYYMGGHTLLEYSKVKYNIGLPKKIFTERYLRKPPMKYLMMK